MRVLSILSLAVLVVSCTPGRRLTRPAVSEAALDAFFETVERRDFHEIARTGQEVFVPGHYITDHAALFARFPSSQPERGRVRYVLYSFRGSASLGEVYIVLESESGQILEFNHFDAQVPIPSDAAGLAIDIRTDKQSYSARDTLVVTIENNLDGPISYYDGCALRQCGYLEEEWGCIWKECHGQTVVLGPERSVEMRTGANAHLGTRQVLELDCLIVSTGVPYTARSNEFRVE